MQYRTLGNTGLVVSRLCLGCMSFGDPNAGLYSWTLDEGRSRVLLRAALEAGINFFDTANQYSAGTSEEIVGRALREYAYRDEVVIATKGFAPWRNAPNAGGLSRKALFAAVDDSLRRLGVDYIDLYQLHRLDPQTPIEETLRALEDIVRCGKVRYIGASSMYAWQLMQALMIADRNQWPRFVSMQNHFNLLYREEEREMLPLCLDQGVGVIPWSPLARGRLARDFGVSTERTQDDVISARLYGATEDNDRKIAAVAADIARERGVPRAQIAIAWLLANPAVTAPIIGTSRPEHLSDALGALELKLSAAELERLAAPYEPHPVAGLFTLPPFNGRTSVRGPDPQP